MSDFVMFAETISGVVPNKHKTMMRLPIIMPGQNLNLSADLFMIIYSAIIIFRKKCGVFSMFL